MPRHLANSNFAPLAYTPLELEDGFDPPQRIETGMPMSSLEANLHLQAALGSPPPAASSSPPRQKAALPCKFCGCQHYNTGFPCRSCHICRQAASRLDRLQPRGPRRKSPALPRCRHDDDITGKRHLEISPLRPHPPGRRAALINSVENKSSSDSWTVWRMVGMSLAARPSSASQPSTSASTCTLNSWQGRCCSPRFLVPPRLQ